MSETTCSLILHVHSLTLCHFLLSVNWLYGKDFFSEVKKLCMLWLSMGGSVLLTVHIAQWETPSQGLPKAKSLTHIVYPLTCPCIWQNHKWRRGQELFHAPKVATELFPQRGILRLDGGRIDVVVVGLRKRTGLVVPLHPGVTVPRSVSAHAKTKSKSQRWEAFSIPTLLVKDVLTRQINCNIVCWTKDSSFNWTLESSLTRLHHWTPLRILMKAVKIDHFNIEIKCNDVHWQKAFSCETTNGRMKEIQAI